MGFRRVLIALDESAAAAHASDVGVELARALGADAAFVYAVDPLAAAAPDSGVPSAEILERDAREGKDLLARNAAQSKLEPPPAQFLRTGRPAHEIIGVAGEWHADVIVMASHGRGGVTRLLMGSVAEGVMRHAPCPVLVVRAGT